MRRASPAPPIDDELMPGAYDHDRPTAARPSVRASRCGTSSSVASVIDQRTRARGPGRGAVRRKTRSTHAVENFPNGTRQGCREVDDELGASRRQFRVVADAPGHSDGRNAVGVRAQHIEGPIAHHHRGARPQLCQCCCDRLCLVGAASTQIWACDDLESLAQFEQIKQRPSERQRLGCGDGKPIVRAKFGQHRGDAGHGCCLLQRRLRVARAVRRYARSHGL